MQPRETYVLNAVSALIRAERETNEELHQAICHRRLPDDVLGCLTGYRISNAEPDDYSASEEFDQPVALRRRFGFWRRKVRRFPTSF